MLLSAIVVLALAAAGVMYQLAGLRQAALRYPCTGTLVDLGGRRLHVVTAGQGTPSVVFEAGIAATSLSWAHVLPATATITRTCAYDRAGLGWSDHPPRRPSLESIVDDLEAALTAAGVTPPHVLVGHSFGCFVICAYASRHPTRVAGFVFVDPPAANEWREPTPERRRLLQRGIRLSHVGGALARVGFVRACLALLAGGAPKVPGTMIKTLGPTAVAKLHHLVHEVRKLPPEVQPMVQAHWSDAKCFRAMANHLRVLQEAARFVGSLASLPDVPMVVISSGELSREKIAENEALARLSSSGRHVVAERSDHWIQFDEPQLVIDAIRDVLGRQAGVSATAPSNR